MRLQLGVGGGGGAAVAFKGHARQGCRCSNHAQADRPAGRHPRPTPSHPQPPLHSTHTPELTSSAVSARSRLGAVVRAGQEGLMAIAVASAARSGAAGPCNKSTQSCWCSSLGGEHALAAAGPAAPALMVQSAEPVKGSAADSLSRSSELAARWRAAGEGGRVRVGKAVRPQIAPPALHPLPPRAS